MNDKILTGKVCPYCEKETELISSKEIYGGRDYGMIYICKPCDAYVGTHKDNVTAKGRLANKQLRGLKVKAHSAFDKIWQSKRMNRTQAYEWLSGVMKTETDKTHIGMFNEQQCKDVVYFSEQLTKGLK